MGNRHRTRPARLPRPTRLVRLVAVAALTMALHATPVAAAVTPPPVDRALLPAAAPPAPPAPTVQREVCTVPTLTGRPGPAQLDGLDLPAVWELTRGAGQRVAVIDTGVAPHRRLSSLVAGGDYVFTGDGTQDCDGHGTLVAGIIAAAPDPATDGFMGVAPQATVLGIRQSSTRFGAAADAQHPGVGDVGTLAAAVRTAADLGASVINISTVACRDTATGFDDRALGAALAYAVETRHAVVVAAAGNTGDGEPCGAAADGVVSPAWYDEYVLTVGSVDAHGAASSFTRPGPWVDVAAPGEAVRSLSPIGDATADSTDGPRSGELRGTSFAAPVVSGLAALIRSRFPEWTPRQVMDRIRETAHHPPGGRDDAVGAGVIDPVAALSREAPADIPAIPTGPANPTVPAVPAGPATVPPAVAPQPEAPASSRGPATGVLPAVLAVLAAAVIGRAVAARPAPSRRSPGSAAAPPADR